MGWFEKVKKNPVFKFMSSVKMAVPLMVALAIIVAVGTVIESRYNAQVAQILIYRAGWFEGLLILLGVNILFSALSRIPYREQHVGFVLTHVGLLILLGGAVMTSEWGLDGQLRVVEGQTANLVGVSEMTLKVASAKDGVLRNYPFKRSLEELNGSHLGFGKRLARETGLVVEKYLPFVARESRFESKPGMGGGTMINFTIESSMFGKNLEWLHAKEKPEVQLGPAVIRLVVDQEEPGKSGKKPAKKGKKHATAELRDELVSSAAAPVPAGGELVVRDDQGKELARIAVSKIRKAPQTIQGVKISVVKIFQQAVVEQGKVVDRGEIGANPAVEIRLEKSGKVTREFSFAKYPGFSMNQAGAGLGLRFDYSLEGILGTQMPAGHPQVGQETGGMGGEGSAAAPAADGNRIEFHVQANAQEGDPVLVDLHKGEKRIFSKQAKIGEWIETPWMGMKIVIDSVVPNAVAVESVRPLEIAPRGMLPDSAIFVRAEGAPSSAGLWMVEGDYKTIQAGDKNFELYYGVDSVELPFSIHLEKFEKVDYPGTETPMSFQSTVKVNGTGNPILISMNEPLKYAGYTLYQSSYEMGMGPTASIFSVNQDPGRFVKYFGSLVLCLGIVLFSFMRSEWYRNWKKGKGMKKHTATSVLMTVFLAVMFTFSGTTARAEAQTWDTFELFARKINSSAIAELGIQSHGRLKPFHSLARETILYITGKYSKGGLDATQLYLALMVSDLGASVDLINIRDPKLRELLGFTKKDRYVSLQTLERSRLEELARPGMMKQEQNDKNLTPSEKAALELMQQVWLTRAVISGRHLMDGITIPGTQPQGAQPSGPVFEKTQEYLRTLASGNLANADMLAKELVEISKTQPMPEMFRKNADKLGMEVFYNQAHLFSWVAFGYLLIGLILVTPFFKKFSKQKRVLLAVMVPFLIHIAGFWMRVVITGFAPVTNMYGTMLWVAFGVVLFGGLLFLSYRNHFVYGFILLGAALTLILTESLPLVLSPDMDPIVAVLRSNFWLTIHVLTITISYAGFTIAMLLGNVALVRGLISDLKPQRGAAALAADEKYYKEYSLLTYRVMQIGVFFLTAGIILGGIWADYSWGRFWGWDPKETWSLIALLGYLAILHAKYLGWLGAFGVLASAPVAYLLVIMAWYGVNFILASGLHSYGFSSGGAAAIATFVGVQLFLLATALAVHNWRKGAGKKV